MALFLTQTGSYAPVRFPPPSLTEQEVYDSIHQAVRIQQEIIVDQPVQWVFVSGQPQNDIVGIFAAGLGLDGDALPYRVNREIQHTQPITLREVEIASEALQGSFPLKAHVTDPSLMAECLVEEDAPKQYREDALFPRELILAFSHALAEEARVLTCTPNLPVKYLQIDAPTLAYGADLELAHHGIGIITEAVNPAVQTILHVCGDTSKIMDVLLDMPVNILNIEYQHVKDLPWLNANRLSNSKKKLSLGIIPVNTHEIPTQRRLERELLFAAEQYGVENIWGITPNCGLRLSDPTLARQRLERLVEVAVSVAPRFNEM